MNNNNKKIKEKVCKKDWKGMFYFVLYKQYRVRVRQAKRKLTMINACKGMSCNQTEKIHNAYIYAVHLYCHNKKNKNICHVCFMPAQLSASSSPLDPLCIITRYVCTVVTCTSSSTYARSYLTLRGGPLVSK